MFPEVQSHHFEMALKDLEAKGFKNVDATDLLQQLDAVSAMSASAFSSYTSYLVCGVVAVLIAGGLIWYCWKKKNAIANNAGILGSSGNNITVHTGERREASNENKAPENKDHEFMKFY